MIIWSIFRTFLGANGFMVAVCLGGLAVFWTYDSSRVNAGKRQQKYATEKANAKVDKLGTGAARKSGTPKSRGVRNPHYRR